MAKKIMAMFITIITMMTISTPAFAADNPFDAIRETAEDYVPQLRNDDYKREFDSDDGAWHFVISKKGDRYIVKAKYTQEVIGETTDGNEITDLSVTFKLTKWDKETENDLRSNGISMGV